MARNQESVLAEWRASVADLGNRLVTFDADPIVALVRAGQLSGGSASTWTDADAGVAAAWTTFQEVRDLLDRAGLKDKDLAATLAAAQVSAPGGPTDASSALRAARGALDAAEAIRARIALAWEDLGPRIDAARASAESSGDTASGRAANALRDLLNSDPLGVLEPDLATIEAAADESARRSSAATTAVARLDLDLLDARRSLDQLDTDVQTASGTIGHAMSRVQGLSGTVPVPDLDALAAWLGRIEETAAREPGHAAGALDDWMAALATRRAELDTALAPIEDAMQRRERARGLWTALRAKAAGRRLDEDPTVAQALEEAQDLLWAAPCDLAAAELSLGRLASTLESKVATATDEDVTR
jgi:hypothetical protein